jgi:hypothetical protein
MPQADQGIGKGGTMTRGKMALAGFTVLVAVVVGAVFLLSSRGGTTATTAPVASAGDATPTASSSQAAAEPAVHAPELSGALKQIQTLELPSPARKRLIVAYLAFINSPESPAFAYWAPPALREAEERIRAFEVADAARKIVRSEYGDAALDDPEFAFLFRPYADRYPNLSATKQLELQRISIVPMRALVASNLSPIQAQVAVKASQREVEAEISRLLSPAEWQEYQRKESSAVRSLANSGFKFTQQEFDAVLPTVAQGDGPVGMKRFDPASTEALREALGPKRYLEYRKSQDPTFHMLSAIVSAHGKQNADVDAAYEAVYSNQEASAQMLRAGPVLGFDDQRKKEQMTADLRTRLTKEIGGEATDVFMRSMDSNRGLVQARMF